MEAKHTTDEFIGNVKVTISEKEVRVWVCDEKGCQFRFKAMGEVVRLNGIDSVVVAAKNNSHDASLAVCEKIIAFNKLRVEIRPDPGDIETYFYTILNDAKAAIAEVKKGT